MAPSKDDRTPMALQQDGRPEARLDLRLGDVPSLEDVAHGMLHRLKCQNSALEQLKQALDDVA
jgi:NifU-like protein involved in Fe-S cluster formation